MLFLYLSLFSLCVLQVLHSMHEKAWTFKLKMHLNVMLKYRFRSHSLKMMNNVNFALEQASLATVPLKAFVQLYLS